MLMFWRIKIKVNARMLNASHFEFVFDLFMSVQRVGTSCGNKTANHFEPDGIHGQTAVISPIAMRAKQVEGGGAESAQNASMHLPDLPSYRTQSRQANTLTHTYTY